MFPRLQLNNNHEKNKAAMTFLPAECAFEKLPYATTFNNVGLSQRHPETDTVHVGLTGGLKEKIGQGKGDKLIKQ